MLYVFAFESVFLLSRIWTSNLKDKFLVSFLLYVPEAARAYIIGAWRFPQVFACIKFPVPGNVRDTCSSIVLVANIFETLTVNTPRVNFPGQLNINK